MFSELFPNIFSTNALCQTHPYRIRRLINLILLFEIFILRASRNQNSICNYINYYIDFISYSYKYQNNLQLDIKIIVVAMFSRQFVIGIALLDYEDFNIFDPDMPLLLKGWSTMGDDELLFSKGVWDVPQNMRAEVRQCEDFLVININDCSFE